LAQDFKQHYSEFEYFSYRLEEVFGPEFTKSDTFDKILKSTSGGIENGEYGKMALKDKHTIAMGLISILQSIMSSAFKATRINLKPSNSSNYSPISKRQQPRKICFGTSKWRCLLLWQDVKGIFLDSSACWHHTD
jgi:hypothetical protein